MIVTHVFKRTGDLSIDLDVHLPFQDEQSEMHAANVLLYIHGGAFCAMDKTDIPHFVLRWAQQRRHILVSINYRLAPQAKLDDCFSDVQDALAWIVAEHGLRATLTGTTSFSGKIAVIGGSAGGWLALLTASLGHPSVKAAAAIYPMTNISDEHYTSPWQMPATIEKGAIQSYLDQPVVQGAPPDFDYQTGTITGRHNVAIYMAQNALWQRWLLGVDTEMSIDDQKAVLDKWDVRLHAHARWTPTFFLHGRADVTILPSNSLDMARALEQANVPHALVEVDGAAHFFDMLAEEDKEQRLGIVDLINFVEERM